MFGPLLCLAYIIDTPDCVTSQIKPFAHDSLQEWEEVNQGFMQDKIIVSHTCFSGHIDVNC